MTAILSPDVTVDDKVTAFDNFEQLIENLDNANNMESLGLWMPLVQQLDNEEAELRRMAAWCVGTAVQNNVKSQERLLIVGGIPKLTKMATNDTNAAVRKKAVFALSSEVRNYQPALNEAQKALPDEFRGREDIDAGDMEAVDGMMAKLRHSATKAI
ncbi:hsp70 nucleotide exchange factor fes1 [Cryomyces antarcticus]|uniref:Hsp70 nucleotide exchange factor fes1 n=1 Tax=Cryomyces antarcticus TaxID=329879 RepID=A0ABR0LUE1_9PEZI|nr:hsp70 nucleotide exchange factor fes1 [Cryomyces antarcticus]